MNLAYSAPREVAPVNSSFAIFKRKKWVNMGKPSDEPAQNLKSKVLENFLLSTAHENMWWYLYYYPSDDSLKPNYKYDANLNLGYFIILLQVNKYMW